MRSRVLIALPCVILATVSFGQTNKDYYAPSSANSMFARVMPKTTLFLPTGCGVPFGIMSLKSDVTNIAAVYVDSCGHKNYIYDPSTKTWSIIGTGANAGNADSLNHQLATYYLNRSNHTGAQTQSTVTGLPDSLLSKVTRNGSYADPDWITSLAKSKIGLGNVDNTSDANKPVSTAQAAADALKVDKTTTVNGHSLSSDVTVSKGDVGLGNVDNTPDASKPVSTAQQTAIDLKVNISDTSAAHSGYQRSGNPVTVAAQPNITSLGTLSNVSVTGRIDAGSVSVTNGIIASYFSGGQANLHDAGGLTLSNISPISGSSALSPGSNMDLVKVSTLDTVIFGSSGYSTLIKGTLIRLGSTTAITGNLNVSNMVEAAGLSGGSGFFYNDLFVGDDALITGSLSANDIAASSLSTSGAITGTTLAGTLTTGAQPNITLIGTLNLLTVSGSILVGGSSSLWGIQASANSNTAGIGAGVFNQGGAGAIVTFLQGSLPRSQINNDGSFSGNAATATTAGTVTTASQPNITSLGDLTNLTVSGLINAAGITTSGDITSNGFKKTGGTGTNALRDNGTVQAITSGNTGSTIVARNFAGGFAAGDIVANNVSVSGDISGTITTASQPNITTVGTLAGLTVTAPIGGKATGNYYRITASSDSTEVYLWRPDGSRDTIKVFSDGSGAGSSLDTTKNYHWLATQFFTDSLVITQSGLAGNLTNTGIRLQNTTSASSGLQQPSPLISLTGNYYNTSSGASRATEFGVYVNPVQGNNVTGGGALNIDAKLNNGTWVNALSLMRTPAGNTLNIAGALTSSGKITSSNAIEAPTLQVNATGSLGYFRRSTNAVSSSLGWGTNGSNDFLFGEFTSAKRWAIRSNTAVIPDILMIDSVGGVFVGVLGTGAVYSNASYLTSTNPSDKRLKNSIIPYKRGLKEVLAMRPVTYYFNDDVKRERLQFGEIAQHMQKIIPEAVRPISKGSDTLGLEHPAIYMAAINAIQEQQKQIDALKKEIKKLKSKLK